MIDFNTARRQRAEQITADITPQDPISSLRAKMVEHGLSPNQLIQDAAVHRFDVDKRGDKAGWYIFFGGDVSAASFGNWQTGAKENWCQFKEHEMSEGERLQYRRQLKEASKRRKEEERKNHDRARFDANRIWNEATPVEHHEYLDLKGVLPHYTRLTKNGDLVVPSLDDKGIIWSLQYINANGAKKFQPLGKRDGLFFEILGNSDIYLCEGFATGATIHEATGGTVLCTFTAGNLPKVARIVGEKYPGAKVTICADNDQFKPQLGNVGINKANEAAALITNATVVYPTFDNIDTKPTDFNDLFKLEGKDAVLTQLGTAKEKPSFPPATDSLTRLKDRCLHRPPQKEFIWECFDEGFLPKGVVGVLAATGGTGKTFMLCSFAIMSAAGKAFGPIAATKPLKTLIVCGEDDQEEVERRLWDITGGKFPDLLHAISVYGEVGPLMELDGNKPVRAEGFYWLEKTIQGHKGLELLIVDPKSRFYGLDENNNDHATQWVRCLEYLSKKYGLTIIFSAHTSEQNSEKISQKMNRGASALVDGCRWQAGLIRMSQKEGDRLGIDNPRQYVIMDTPKNNYAKDVNHPLVFRRTDNGTLEYVSGKELGEVRERASNEAIDNAIVDLLGTSEWENSPYNRLKTSSFYEEVRILANVPFNDKMLFPVIERLRKEERIVVETINSTGAGRPQKIVKLPPVPF